MSAKKIDFDASLKSLEDIVAKMEKGDLGLEESLQQFDAGIKIAKACQQKLNEAELQVQHANSLQEEP